MIPASLGSTPIAIAGGTSADNDIYDKFGRKHVDVIMIAMVLTDDIGPKNENSSKRQFHPRNRTNQIQKNFGSITAQKIDNKL